MSRITLLQKLKPEIKSKLEQERSRYSASIDVILYELNNEEFYNSLSIKVIRDIYLFADLNEDEADWKYGTNLFKDD